MNIPPVYVSQTSNRYAITSDVHTSKTIYNQSFIVEINEMLLTGERNETKGKNSTFMSLEFQTQHQISYLFLSKSLDGSNLTTSYSIDKTEVFHIFEFFILNFLLKSNGSWVQKQKLEEHHLFIADITLLSPRTSTNILGI